MATKEPRNNYGIVEIDYVKYVLPIDDAMTVATLLAEAERYSSDYVKDEVSGNSSYVHKIVPATLDQKQFTIKVLPATLYKAYRMAGDKDCV